MCTSERYGVSTRCKVLLIHGMNNDQTWWQPFLPLLNELGVTISTPRMPDLEMGGPEKWVDIVGKNIGTSPLLLIGHSLGAAVALKAAITFHIGSVILCGIPIITDTSIPQMPAMGQLSMTAMAKIALFLKDVSTLFIPDFVHDRYCLSGADDPWSENCYWEQKGFICYRIKNCNHEANQSIDFSECLADCITASEIGRTTLDPGIRFLRRGTGAALTDLDLDVTAPPPARLDIEITSKCQLTCRYCARSLYTISNNEHSMNQELFLHTLDECSTCKEIIFVGLGEPLLHPKCTTFIHAAYERGIRTWLVTNGLLAGPAIIDELKKAGLDELTFSIDTTDKQLFAELRGGASFETVYRNACNAKKLLSISLFTALSRKNIATLPSLIDLIGELELPALTVSGLNFIENHSANCSSTNDKEYIESSIRHAHDAGIFLLGPHLHNFPKVTSAIRHCRINTSDDILKRSSVHTHCLAPWRIAVVGSEGTVTPCNCAPTVAAGNIRQQPFDAIWNGTVMREWRLTMRENRNQYCRNCPRY